ncbi:hypothetical protein SP5_034_01240 [Sphingomonas parapaucimobilis NBRC 15100]|uniref:Uncharacterized protein n=1 Tax=Sphingomonas parapaucimobilis NBRC 15100 TaxID=1219049 RepID=A0A0A1W6K8_9SPHN|nr:hypothetical protein SP5_034_01240 [Sphingomonas parapaucimobilis NBRC 15100]
MRLGFLVMKIGLGSCAVTNAADQPFKAIACGFQIVGRVAPLLASGEDGSGAARATGGRATVGLGHLGISKTRKGPPLPGG